MVATNPQLFHLQELKWFLCIMGVIILVFLCTLTSPRVYWRSNGSSSNISPLKRDIFKMVTIDVVKSTIGAVVLTGGALSLSQLVTHAFSFVVALVMYYKFIEPRIVDMPEI